MANQRSFELIVWGATGFTGKLVAEYLQQRYGSDGDLRWAMAARNEDKLRQVAEQIGARVPLLTADSHDLPSLKTLCSQTQVICSVVGPYAAHGSELVQACVEEKTHYCDLTGEVPWMRKIIDQHHAQAQQKQVKIVHTCGFDSIPSDLGVFFMQKKALSETGSYLKHIRYRFKAGRGGFSGGTIASLGQIMSESKKDPAVQKLLLSPYGLNPRDDQPDQDGPDLTQATLDPLLDA
ncbi:MAG: saccharopine dehydrogenase NADP-binding domain-containing protein, partial [Bacteroidota bacterium]